MQGPNLPDPNFPGAQNPQPAPFKTKQRNTRFDTLWKGLKPPDQGPPKPYQYEESTLIQGPRRDSIQRHLLLSPSLDYL